MSNLEIVEQYFALFLAGKTQEAFELISDKAVWTIKGSDNVPTVGRWEGKEQITRFFDRFARSFEPKEFNIMHYFPAEDKVFVIGNFTHFVKPTSRLITSDWMIQFTLKDGKITGYKILEDSYGLYRSFLKD